MPKNGGGNNSNQFKNGLTYNAKVPAFLQALKKQIDGSAGSSRRRDDRSESPVRVYEGREGRDPIPERPREGQWAGGSDDEGGAGKDEFGRAKRASSKGKGKASDDEEEEDEWDKKFGGGQDDDGPQIVVVNEGKHLTADQYKLEREKAKGNGADAESWKDVIKESQSSSSAKSAPTPNPSATSKPSNTFGSSTKTPNSASTNNKRKLVPDSSASDSNPKSVKQSKKEKKKEKDKKGLLSFGDEEEG